MTHEPFDLVIYHANCLDGFAAAWAAHKHSPGAEFIPATYGDVPPDVVGKRVLVVDFSYSRPLLVMMHTVAAELLVLDHHKTAAEDLAGLDFAVFDMERSGCGITWDTLLRHKRPRIITHVEDRDLWLFRHANTKPFVAALAALPRDFTEWEKFSHRPNDILLERGYAIMQHTQRTCQAIAALAYSTHANALIEPYEPWQKVPTLAVNCPPQFVSDVSELLKPRAAGRAIVGWFFDGERGDFVFSLRSADDGPDVSEIARAFGGGGHKHAAGFRCGHNPLVKS